MAANIERIVSKCQSRARNYPTYHHKWHLQFFSAAGPMDFIAMDIVEQFTRTTRHNQYIPVMTDHYSKLTHTISTIKTTSTHTANDFIDQCLGPYRISTYRLPYNDVQFTSKFFAMS